MSTYRIARDLAGRRVVMMMCVVVCGGGGAWKHKGQVTQLLSGLYGCLRVRAFWSLDLGVGVECRGVHPCYLSTVPLRPPYSRSCSPVPSPRNSKRVKVHFLCFGSNTSLCAFPRFLPQVYLCDYDLLNVLKYVEFNGMFPIPIF